MKKLVRIFSVLLIMLSLAVCTSCGCQKDDGNGSENQPPQYNGGGVQGPIVPYE